VVRLLSGAILAAATLAAILFLPIVVLRVLVSFLAMFTALEYFRLTRTDARLAGVVLVSCWLASYGSPAALSAAVLLVVGAVAWQVLWNREALHRAAAGGLAGAYVGIPLGLLVATQSRHGWRATVLLIATIVVSDTAQLYSGRLFGRHLLAPAVSPKKTIEGAIGGAVFGTLFVVVAGGRALPAVGVVNLAVLGLMVVALGICGDLFESQVKREAGVKDSSDLIPGHGGLLDRIDALLFAVPAFYAYLGVTA
jgi:phosphatidate cytidylyltransferase